MKIITKTLSLSELNQMAEAMFGNMVKAVVDVDREIVAVEGDDLYRADGEYRQRG